MSKFSETVKKIRAEKKMTIRQLSLYTGINNGYISQIENDRVPIPKPETIDKLAKGLRVDNLVLYKAADIIPKSLLSKAGLTPISKPLETLGIPVYGQIVASYPAGYTDDQLGMLPIPKTYVEKYGKDELLALRVIGDSMNKKIPDGYIAVIHKTSDFDNGDIMAVIINGDTATLKHLFKYPEFLRFVPDSYNPNQKPFEYTNEQIKNENPGVVVIGKYLYATSPELIY
ncbi:LexA family protein [Oenococcus sp.]